MINEEKKNNVVQFAMGHPTPEQMRGNVIDANTPISYGVKQNGVTTNYTDIPGQGVTINKQYAPKTNSYTNNNIPIRDAMQNFGFDNAKIGWGGGNNVMYDNQYFMTANRNDDGTTKTDINSLITAANKAYKSSGSDNYITDVTRGAATTGLANAVEYGEGGVVTVAGVPISSAVIVDGVAYAPYNDIVNAVKQSGYKTATDTVREAMSTPRSKSESIANQIENFRDFEYDPEKDIAYQVYKEQYMKNARKAADDTWGRNAARSGGYANSAAMAASDQAYYDHMSELNNVIPLLMDKAYSRYRDEKADLYDMLDMYGTPLEHSKTEMDAQTAQNKLIADAMKADYDRSSDIAEANRLEENERRRIHENDRDYERGIYEFDENLKETKRYNDIQSAMIEKQFNHDVYQDGLNQQNKEAELALKANADARDQAVHNATLPKIIAEADEARVDADTAREKFEKKYGNDETEPKIDDITGGNGNSGNDGGGNNVPVASPVTPPKTNGYILSPAELYEEEIKKNKGMNSENGRY